MLVLTGGALRAEPAAKPTVPKLLDMTYAYGDQTVYWPNATPFKLTKSGWGMTKKGYW